MDKAWMSGASATPPTAPASPSIGYPTGGNLAAGTPPTNPGHWWFHMITSELLNVITSAGITPAQGTLTQLKQALDALYGGGSAGSGTDDYCILPNGQIMQWVKVTITAGATNAVTWPIPFPSACLNAQCSAFPGTYSSGVVESYPILTAQSTIGCSVKNQFIGDSDGTHETVIAQIFAIGH